MYVITKTKYFFSNIWSPAIAVLIKNFSTYSWCNPSNNFIRFPIKVHRREICVHLHQIPYFNVAYDAEIHFTHQTSAKDSAHVFIAQIFNRMVNTNIYQFYFCISTWLIRPASINAKRRGCLYSTIAVWFFSETLWDCAAVRLALKFTHEIHKITEAFEAYDYKIYKRMYLDACTL